MELRYVLKAVAEGIKNKVCPHQRQGSRQEQGILSKGYLLEEGGD